MSEPSFSAPNPSPAAGPQAAPPSIHLSVEEYQRLRTLEQQLDEVRKAQQAAIEAKEAERLRALAEKGQVEEALTQQRKSWEQKHAEATARYSQLEQQVHAERKAAVIAESFEGRSFLGETAEQRAATALMVRRLLQDDFETARDASGALVVRERATGRSASEALRDRLDSPQFAIFFAPSSRGGAGTDGTRPPANPQSSQPGSLDAIVADWRSRQNQYQSFGLRPRG
ncbi:hypothetical protein OJF2_72630 [Aquisphaera giovannonii]|uniref:Uncharacterized protein n=1 Tax=Aquisphaera giovannonii TaxID=406548 RepID=A0A5B9WDR2_9BACT|nr:hypothetical protein [Aquisphaera giovannonii]QEH38657.1 hypothetical protein OJF2_72630 [Aquisphaera giovannonii]